MTAVVVNAAENPDEVAFRPGGNGTCFGSLRLGAFRVLGFRHERTPGVFGKGKNGPRTLHELGGWFYDFW
jgi:hypothetical protein